MNSIPTFFNHLNYRFFFRYIIPVSCVILCILAGSDDINGIDTINVVVGAFGSYLIGWVWLFMYA